MVLDTVDEHVPRGIFSPKDKLASLDEQEVGFAAFEEHSLRFKGEHFSFFQPEA